MTSQFSAASAELSHDINELRNAPAPDTAAAYESWIRSVLALRSQADHVIAAAIADARAAKVSWQVIGDAMGVSRQAAFQRYGKPIDPRTGAPMNTATLPEATDLTRDVVAALAAGDWAKVTTRFDPEMAQAVTADALAEVWAQVVSQVGSLEGTEDPEVARADGLTVTTTQLNFEAGEFVTRIAFRDDQSIAGLFILPPGAAS